jgi:hypothetical protein
MAYVQIPAADTDVNSPLNQTLMDRVRGNDDEIMRSKPLLIRAGYGTNAATVWDIDAGNVAVPNVGATLYGSNRIYVPSGIASLMVNVYARSDFTNANNGIRITVAGGTWDFTSLPGAIAWQVETAGAIGAAGWQDVLIYAVNTSGAARNLYMRGITIRPNV